MPPRAKKPSKEDIKRAADRAEGKKPKAEQPSPLNPPARDEEPDELQELAEAMGVVIPKRKSRAGRPPKYRPEYARIAKKLLSTGSTVPELAEVFGVANSTVWLWRSTYPEFLEAFSELHEDFDARVERALGQRAVGYDYDSVKVFQFNGEPVIVPIKTHVPPDVNAAKFWLAARQSGKWRVKEEVEISASGAVFSELWKQLADKKNKE